jgi:hypothetical protein
VFYVKLNASDSVGEPSVSGSGNTSPDKVTGKKP